MQVHYGEGVANHADPESCAAYREVCGEALTGERAGQPLSHEIFLIQDADVVTYAEGKTNGCDNASARTVLRGRRPWHARTGTGRSPVWPFAVKGWSVSGRRGAVADDVRS